MRPRTAGGLTGLLLLTATAGAVVPRKPTVSRVQAEYLTAMPAAKLGAGKALRGAPTVRFNARNTASWSRFAARAGGRWRAAWDQATGVPSRIYGSGVTVPGANGSPAIAEAAARHWLAQHLDLLAPGAADTDFELVSNHSDGDQRSIGFVQKAGGRRVVGGQISFRFKNDRLFVIASEALPNVKVESAQKPAMKPQQLLARATANLRTELALPKAPVRSLGGEVIVPLVAEDAVLGYRVAVPHEIDGGVDGRYLAYLDPSDGGTIAVEQQNRYANGVLHYRSVDRYPAKGRLDKPAARALVRVGGNEQMTGPTGGISWSPDVEQIVDTGVTGQFVTVANKLDGQVAPLATTQLAIAPGGTAVWDASGTIEDDAQLIAFIATNTVIEYVRANLDPALKTIDQALPVNVNLPNNCNAFWDGKSINFFVHNDSCDNTARLEDVVYHEYGHHLHGNAVIEGVGKFDGSMSEGAADFLATLITNDSGMGRGFNYDASPLRELDPVGDEAVFPKDIGEVHKTGLIYGGAFWDLRKALFAALGEGPGRALIHKLFIATLRRAVSIQTSLIEVLAADDDDGDLANGTPNECLIRDAFGRHGLRTATGTLLAPSAIDLNALSTVVRLDMEDLSSHCSGDDIESAVLDWRPGFTPTPRAGQANMTRVSEGRFYAQMPLAIDGTVVFKAKVKFKDGSELTLADNFADPYYVIYQGPTIPLYCIDFDKTNPFADGWTTGTSDGSPSPWEWGEPNGEGATDPPFAFTGTKIVSQGLNKDYLPKQYSFLKMPPIDVRQYSDVRLQYRRWLAVEDSEFDKARVTVANRQAFVNFTANQGQRSTTHHVDREWRFNDIGVSGYTFGHVIEIAWDMQTDEGLNLGGWAIDDVCVVANRHSICGDGVKNIFEQCDDGPANANEPDKCRTYCLRPVCGDKIVDEGEVCDEGFGGTDTCSAACELIPPTDTGCCSSGGGRGAGGATLLGGLVGVLLFRRRRR